MSTLPRSDFPAATEQKHIADLFCFERAHCKVLYFFMFSFMALETKLTNITTRQFCSFPFFELNIPSYISLSLIGIFLPYFFVLTYFDSLRRHTHASTHATVTQIVRAKMTSLDAIFFLGETTRVLVLSLAFTAENIKNLKLALRAREKI